MLKSEIIVNNSSCLYGFKNALSRGDHAQSFLSSVFMFINEEKEQENIILP